MKINYNNEKGMADWVENESRKLMKINRLKVNIQMNRIFNVKDERDIEYLRYNQKLESDKSSGITFVRKFTPIYDDFDSIGSKSEE